jgi:hypothetical protein
VWIVSHLKKLVVRNLASPTLLALFSCSLFAFGWLFPPDLYAAYVHESDWLFLSPVCLLYFCLCVVGFFFGVYFSRYMSGSSFNREPPQISTGSPLFYVVLPVVIMTIMCSIYLVLLGGRINFVALLASQQGSSLKTASETGTGVATRWGMAQVFLTAALGWAQYRALQLKLRKSRAAMFWIVFSVGWLVDATVSVALVDRTQLMPLMASTIVIAIFFKTRGKHVRLFRIAALVLVSMIALVGTFLLLSFLRGSLLISSLVRSLLGYTIVSYNRMAALLLGAMHYNYEGTGVYLVQFLSGSEGLNKIVPFKDLFGWPTARELWHTEFASVAQAGLDPSYIWASTFGYLFSDIGWLTPFYMFFYGLFACYFWIKFKTGKAMGLVVYPWVAFGIMFWVGVNFLLYDRLLNYIEVGLLLTLYDHFWIRVIHVPNKVSLSTDRPVLVAV